MQNKMAIQDTTEHIGIATAGGTEETARMSLHGPDQEIGGATDGIVEGTTVKTVTENTRAGARGTEAEVEIETETGTASLTGEEGTEVWLMTQDCRSPH